eukprot:Sspe_Gene.99267::Locus_72711_Transcript_1_1_Confidence_1.000_Length_824::g.99267::m.99267
MPKKKGSKKKGKAKKGAKVDTADSVESMIDERFYMGPYHNERRKAAYRKRIDNAFRMFERHTESGKERTCDWREVKTIVRSLDLNPTCEQLASMLEEVEEPEPTGYIRYEKLEELLLRVLMTKEYVPAHKKMVAEGETEEFVSGLLVRDSEERIIEAFQAIDTTKRGELEAEAFGNLMMKSGRPGEEFDREEVVDMIQAAADPETGLIKYEDSLYVDQLAYD